MSAEYIIVTDDSCDLPKEYLNEHKVPFVRLSFLIDGKEYQGDQMPVTEFYQLMRSGEMPVTAQTNQQEFVDTFTPFLQEGKDIIYLAFSSGLSGTCHSGQAAAKDLAKQFPDRNIIVVDTLCASLGQGLLVHKLIEKRDQGATIQELEAYAYSLVPHVVHTLTVDDLMHLHRGGRVSKAAAIAGSLLGIKPHLGVDDEGHLIAAGKVRGRKAALEQIVIKMEELVGDTENDIFMISHGDCLEDAEYVEQLVKERLGVEKSLLNYIGPVIGTHAGPGTVALFMLGEKRM